MKRLETYLKKIINSNDELFNLLLYRNREEVIGLIADIFEKNIIIEMKIVLRDSPKILRASSLQRIQIKIIYKCKECGVVKSISFPLSAYKYKVEAIPLKCPWCETELK